MHDVTLDTQDSKKLLEARIKALQAMVDTLSTSEGSLETALQKQMATLTERNAQVRAHVDDSHAASYRFALVRCRGVCNGAELPTVLAVKRP
jgi:hypothetical protein